jgi:peptidoglycan hydrolase CwlO-like protein
MKKTIFFGILMIFMMSASMAFAGKADRKSASDNSAATVKTENKLSEEEISRLTKRVEEIRSMDKSKMTSTEKRELRKELKGIKENVQKRDGVIYIGGGALLVIIIILILVL